MMGNKKRLAIVAIALPYVVDVIMVFSLRGFIGIEGYRSNPWAWDTYGTAIVVSVKAAIVVSWLLSIPFYIEMLRLKPSEGHSRWSKRSFVVAVYFGVNIVNTILVVFFHAIVWAVSGGVI